MAEKNHMADKIDSSEAESEEHHTLNPEPKAVAKYVLVIIAIIILGGFLALYFFWKH